MAEEKKRKVIQEYHIAENFKIAEWFEGIEDLNELIKMGIKITINTLSFSEDIREVKIERLNNKIESYELIAEVGKEKPMNETFVMVEDYEDNLLRSPAKYKILINKPQNKNFNNKQHGIIRADSLKEAISIIRHLYAITQLM